MTPNLSQMTIPELKRYISENRNDEEAFRAALEEIMSRRDPNAPYYPPPSEMTEAEIAAIFKEKIRQIQENQG